MLNDYIEAIRFAFFSAAGFGAFVFGPICLGAWIGGKIKNERLANMITFAGFAHFCVLLVLAASAFAYLIIGLPAPLALLAGCGAIALLMYRVWRNSQPKPEPLVSVVRW